MTGPSNSEIAAVMKQLYPIMDKAFQRFVKLEHGPNVDGYVVMGALMLWALMRHATSAAKAFDGEVRECDAMVKWIKEMVDNHYAKEFSEASARFARIEAAEATLQ